MSIFLPLRSENDTEQYRVRGILADGTEIEGYNKTSMQNFMRPWVTEVKLADANGDSERKYSSDELKVILFAKPDSDSLPVIYHAVRAQKRLPHLFNKNPKAYKKPVFLRLIYD